MITHTATAQVHALDRVQKVTHIPNLEVDLDLIQSLKASHVRSQNEDLVLDLERNLIQSHVVEERVEIRENLRVDLQIYLDHLDSLEKGINLAEMTDQIVNEDLNQDKVLVLAQHRDQNHQIESLSDSPNSVL